MTIQERMVARSEREKDLLKYGRSQERERIIKLLEALKETRPIETNTNYWGYSFERVIALIKGEK